MTMNDTIEDDVPAPAQEHYVADEIIFYGVRLYKTAEESGTKAHKGFARIVVSDKYELRMSIADSKSGDVAPSTQYSIAAVYGYAYDGHCYRFDKPRIFAFEPRKIMDEQGKLIEDPEAPAVGCGFDKTYSMWRLTKSAPLIELSATADTAAELVLEANLPGKRAPNTYRSAMQLAHRGGRLTST
jgi:hypothetical protein